MNDDNYHNSDYKLHLNGGPVDVTPNDNSSEIPAPTPIPTAKPSPVDYIPPINDNESYSPCPIEKPYYEISESSEKPINQHKNCCTKCCDRYDDISIYFIRIFLILTIQYILIISIIFIILNIYKYEIKSDQKYIPAIGLTILALVICIYFRILCMKEERRSSKALYIYIVFFILPIVFIGLLIGNKGSNYLFLLLMTITINFLVILLYIVIFTFKSFKCMIAPAITSLIEIIIIHFWWKLTLEVTFFISIVALILIIYIGFISRQCGLYFKTDDYLFAVLIMDYLIFSIYGLIFHNCFNKYIKVSFMRRERCSS